jgi:PAS domain S-box-containing protein
MTNDRSARLDGAPLGAALDAVPDGVLLVSRDGEIAHANEGACRLLGFDRDELVWRALGSVAKDDGLGANLERLVAGARESCAERTGSIRARRKDGSELELEARARVLAGDEGFVALVLEEAPLAETSGQRGKILAELRDAVRAREELLAIVSHDMKCPLHSIKLSAVNLERVLDAAAGSARRCVASLTSAVARLERLTGDLLDSGSIEAGKLTIDKAPCEAATLVLEALDAMTPIAAEGEVTLAASEPEGSIRVVCDRRRIEQVFANLVGNAVKFAGRGGSVRIEVEARERDVIFAVRDSGPGISAADLPRIFERYFRGAAPAHGGSGLGLAIARGIVDAHGGKIWAESVHGEGATFRFTLPRARS